jgi:hypothetical protein
MRAPRVSIRSLLTAIAVSGVGLALLCRPSPAWANATHTVATVAIVAGASIAILVRGARRAYWLGFSLFGCAYLAMSDQLVTETMLDLLYPYLAPPSSQPAPTQPAPLVAQPVMPVGISVEDPFAPQQVPTAVNVAPPSFVSVSPPTMSAWDYWTKPDHHLSAFLPSEFACFSSRSFRRIGHSLTALLAATLGGVFVRWRYETYSTEGQSAEVTP